MIYFNRIITMIFKVYSLPMYSNKTVFKKPAIGTDHVL